MRSDARVETYAVDYLTGVESLHLSVGVQLVEVSHAQREVGIAEQLDRLGLGGVQVQRRDILLYRAPLEKLREYVRALHGIRPLLRRSHDNAGGIQVVVQRLTLAEELRREDNAVRVFRVLLVQSRSESDRHGGLHNHGAVIVHGEHLLDNAFHRRSVEIVLLRVVVSRGGDDHDVSRGVRRAPVGGGGEAQRLFCEVLLDVFISDGRLSGIQKLHFFRNYVYCGDVVVLRQKNCHRKPDVSCSRYGYFHIVFLLMEIFF